MNELEVSGHLIACAINNLLCLDEPCVITEQCHACEALRWLRDNAFDASDEAVKAAATARGSIYTWQYGDGSINWARINRHWEKP